MKFILSKDKFEINEKESLNSGSVSYYEIPVEKDEEWDGLNIEAVIIKANAEKGIGTAVINNKVFIDRATNGSYLIGFRGYTVQYSLTEDETIDSGKIYYTRSGSEGAYVYTKVENPVVENLETYYEAAKTYQISTKLKTIIFKKGAGEVELENDENIPSLSEWEIYIAQIQDMIDGLEEQIPTKYSDLTNDNNTVQDANYVHTDNNFNNTYKANVDSNTRDRHTHDNKDVLDGISSSDVSNWNNKAQTSDIPTELAELNEDTTHRVVTDTEKATWNSKVDKDVNNLTYYELKTNTGTNINLTIDSSTYVMTLQLKNSAGTVLSTGTIDLPLETMVVGASYDNVNKKIILTLKNGTTVDFSVADLVSGLQTEITSNNKLASDLVDDTNQTNKFVTTEEKNTWNNKVDKVTGKGLSTEDYTTAEKTKLAGIEEEANKTVVDNGLNNTSENPVQNKVIYASQVIQDEKIEHLLNQIPTNTESGESIILKESADFKFKKFKIIGKSKQVTTTGKNLLVPSTLNTRTVNGVEFKPVCDEDNNLLYVNVNGTATAVTTVAIGTFIPVINTAYKVNGCPVGGNSSSAYAYVTGYISNTNGNDTNATWSSSGTKAYQIIVANGATIANMKFYPMIRLATIADNTYEPYTGGQVSPSLSYPQRISNVTGTIVITKSNSDNTQSQTYNFPLGNTKLTAKDYIDENGIHLKRGNTTASIGTSSITIQDMKEDGEFLSSVGGTLSGKTITFDSELTQEAYIEYELAEEILEEFTEEQQTIYNNILNDGAYNGITYVNTTATVKPTLDVEYYMVLHYSGALINTSAQTTITQQLKSYNEYRYGEISSLTITFPTMTNDYISWIVFTSGQTAASFNYPNNVIKWSGDDVSDNDFIPASNKTYNIAFWYDGTNLNGSVRGV